MSVEKAKQIFAECKTAGLSLDDALAASRLLLKKVAKQANFSFLADITSPLAYGAALLPPVAGYIGGQGVARLLDVDKSAITEIQEQELIKELRDSAENIRKRMRLRVGEDEEEEKKKSWR